MFKKISSRLIGESKDTEDGEEKKKSDIPFTASAAATSVLGFMRKAQSAATEIMKEGTAKAVDLKNKAVQAADMDALQKKIGEALDTYVAGAQ